MCFLSIFNSPVWCTKNNNPSCPHSHAHTIDLHKSKKTSVCILEIICSMTILFGILVQCYSKISYWIWVSVTYIKLPFDYINIWKTISWMNIIWFISSVFTKDHGVTNISQSFDFVLYLENYLMGEHCIWNICQCSPESWQSEAYISQSSHISWLCLYVYGHNWQIGTVWPSNWPYNKYRSEL